MGKRLGQAAIVFAATALAACGSAGSSGQGAPSTSPTRTAPGISGWTDTPITNAGSPVTITHPVAWNFVKSDAASQAPSSVAAYFTNAPISKQCESHHLSNGTEYECNGPVAHLSSGQVLITVTGFYLLPGNMTLKTNAVIDGQPAAISRIQDAQMGCPAGTGSGQSLIALLTRATAGPNKPRWELGITACVGNTEAEPGGTTSVDREVAKLLRSVTFPTTVRG